MKYEQILISYMYTHSTYTVRVTCSAAFSTLPGVGISSYIVIDTGEMSFGFCQNCRNHFPNLLVILENNFQSALLHLQIRVHYFQKSFSKNIVLPIFVTFIGFGFSTETHIVYNIITNLPPHFIIGFMSKAVIT